VEVAQTYVKAVEGKMSGQTLECDDVTDALRL
jgi:hypothetical protein